MADHACLLAARLYDPFGQGASHQPITLRAYRAAWTRVTRACGRVASSLGVTAYHLGAVTGCTLVLAVIAAGA